MKTKKGPTSLSGVALSHQALLIPCHILPSAGAYWTHPFDSWSIHLAEIPPKFLVSGRRFVASELVYVLIWGLKWDCGEVTTLGALQIALD